MKLLTAKDLEQIEWTTNPDKYAALKAGADPYNGLPGSLYGYDKAVDPDLKLDLEGGVIDLVRIRPLHVIENHYHEQAEENFSLIGDAPLRFYIRSGHVGKFDEFDFEPGQVLRINANDEHRAFNTSGSVHAYLIRHATKKGTDYFSVEFKELKDSGLLVPNPHDL